ncbi:MAG: dipeptidase PepE [Pirellulaceae bacterium]|nr:dipeptidase PepE [Pirellulaceae bacterium]MDP6556475.1 dipeptidase PepE [Pirellulaceae bacterium]
MARRLLLVSSSRCHPHGYLDHCEAEIRQLFSGVSEVLFVPYARPAGQTHEAYTDVARARFKRMGLSLKGIHEFPDPRAAVVATKGIFIGGGNTFVLLRDLYALKLLDDLRKRIAAGVPYMGTSAGSNIAGLSIGTSNDMPIVQPASFLAIGAVPFNLNPHFPVALPDPTHRGETRDDRLREFHFFNSQPIVALHEDGMLRVEGPHTTLVGQRDALVFRPGQDIQPISPGPVLDDDLLPP